jgi:hypothetical protein
MKEQDEILLRVQEIIKDIPKTIWLSRYEFIMNSLVYLINKLK